MNWIDFLPVMWLILINSFGFILCAVDKNRARKKKWRIPEKNIFITAFLGGSVGVYLSLLLFRHKTKHIAFMGGIPLIFVAEAGVIFFILTKI